MMFRCNTVSEPSMIILNINGPINSGKSTVSKILASKIPNSVFIEIDDLLSGEEQDKLHLDFHGGILERLNRFDNVISAVKQNPNINVVIFAYPMGEGNYSRWIKLKDATTEFINITLAPSLDKCLTNRGTRELENWEIVRIKEMYAEKYHENPHADLTICNDNQTPDETASLVMEFLLTHSIHKP
ncbi:hypothetical protein FACS1894152_6950 [Bacilli bacterium]|nr:hypothetical protein FACS1894152_6950 [Bacilli bacterium]